MAIDGDKVEPGVFLTLGGEERRLVLDKKAWFQLERVTQRSLLASTLTIANFNDAVLWTWAGLLRCMPQLGGFVSPDGKPDAKAQAGIDQVIEWIEMKELADVFAAISEAIKQSQPKPDPEAAEKN